MSDSLGKLFRITSFGESHGQALGIVVEGCPAGLPLTEADIQPDLDRRRPAASPVSTPRREADEAVILSGVLNGQTTGAPLCLLTWNRDADSSAYETLKNIPRPGHADYTAYVKYTGLADRRGGGRFSGRITAGFVMAGAVARKVLTAHNIEVLAHTIAIGGIPARAMDVDDIRRLAPQSALRCADTAAEKRMSEALEAAREAGDSLGGVVEVQALGVPAGWGEPVFSTADGELARAYLAVPAVKGVEFGAGFRAAELKGSENNDPFIIRHGSVTTTSNNAGGILGGITNGQAIVARIAVKPTPSIAQKQRSINLATMTETEITIAGRHDACIVPRAVVVMEAMTAIVLCDLGRRAGTLSGVMK
jgi:chorismate synthase